MCTGTSQTSIEYAGGTRGGDRTESQEERQDSLAGEEVGTGELYYSQTRLENPLD